MFGKYTWFLHILHFLTPALSALSLRNHIDQYSVYWLQIDLFNIKTIRFKSLQIDFMVSCYLVTVNVLNLVENSSGGNVLL